MKVSVQAPADDIHVIRQLLAPWDIQFARVEEAEVSIVYKEKPLEGSKILVIPSDSHVFDLWAKETESQIASRAGQPVSILAGKHTVLTITPTALYCDDGFPRGNAEKGNATERKLNSDLSVLTLDVVRGYNEISYETLNARSSSLYRLLAFSPIPYGIVPKRLTNLFLKSHQAPNSLTICDKLPMDALRFALAGALERLVGKKIRRKTWNGRNYVYLVTHDVETKKGLQTASYLEKLEEKYNVPSAWYIPSRRYKLEQGTIQTLANHGEVGAHDTTHDGKLTQLPRRRLAERLRDAKRDLEIVSRQAISGFRTPLLQHNARIIEALEEVGYAYDTSIPTWEPAHPYTLKPHGIGTIYPLKFKGLTEIPVTLPQDHQLLYVLDLAPKEIGERWLEMASVIRDLGGICTFLVHPDYKLACSSVYEELLNTIASDSEAWVTVPSNISSFA